VVHASAIPSIRDIGDLLAYIFGNPYLFLSSTTWMTSALVVGAAVVSFLPHRLPVLHRAAPTLAVILTYFGVGSLALSTEILIRFHASIPHETEVQFVSGIGHLVEALVGLALLSPHLRHHARTDWLWAHTVALAYWTFQIAVLTPPWFSFQGQRELVTTFALVLMLASGSVNVALWRGAGRSSE
jgi:hypothetical protein